MKSNAAIIESPLPVRYRFGHFELQPDERRLLASGASMPLGPRAFELLVVLVERAPVNW